MSSIIPGYEYDIFISYRQKDNKGERWVSEFVEALKTELESTFKEEINVYFDINPHDGLLETHDVDASLKEKLKCLVFIPIISRTYCDPKSFAWEHEFKAFVEEASQDQFGLKVKLSGGNIASRVLPIQIHDLSAEDKKLVESELGGYLRGIEFIYKEPGVNRPLMAHEDHPDNNLNKTFYRNQINKVANAINEIIGGLRSTDHFSKGVSEKTVEVKSSVSKNLRTRIILALVIGLVLVALGYFIITKLSKSSISVDKSIAVLPFINDSPNDSTTYFINGLMEEILTNLQKVKAFSKVLSRTSTEQYRGKANLSIPKISKELDVNYIVEGSGQKYGNSYRIRVQLIEGKTDKHLWADSYEKEIMETKDIYGIQSQIAQTIAEELKTIITPEEKQLIEKVPTENLTALEFYQMGREEEKFPFYDLIISSTILAGVHPPIKQSVKRAEKMYKTALKFDSAFAPAYTGLAGIYWSKNYFKEYLSENFMDSALSLANRALYFDDQLPDAYFIRGMYYSQKEETYKQALVDFDKTLKLNPNYWLAYYSKGEIDYDAVMAIKNYIAAASHHSGPGLSEIYNKISFKLSYTGFSELAKNYSLKAVKLESDSTKYYFWLNMYEFEYKKCFEFYKKKYSVDSTNIDALEFLSEYYDHTGQFKEDLKFKKKWLAELKAQGKVSYNGMQRVGYAYWKNGFKDSADYYFNKQIENCNNAIRLGRSSYSSAAYYDLAGVYAFKGDKIKAYENLKIFNKRPCIWYLWIVRFIEFDPLFDSIRNEKEFQQIEGEMEAKYQADHERARKWLEENNML